MHSTPRKHSSPFWTNWQIGERADQLVQGHEGTEQPVRARLVPDFFLPQGTFSDRSSIETGLCHWVMSLIKWALHWTIESYFLVIGLLCPVRTGWLHHLCRSQPLTSLASNSRPHQLLLICLLSFCLLPLVHWPCYRQLVLLFQFRQLPHIYSFLSSPDLCDAQWCLHLD